MGLSAQLGAKLCNNRGARDGSLGGPKSFGGEALVDIELKLVDAIRNRHRQYGITEGRTLFGEPCLIIAWGRIGNRCRVRTEVFSSRGDLARRRDELLRRRRQHGYVGEV